MYHDKGFQKRQGFTVSWRLARSLETLRAEINESAPTRSKISDGTIGDTAHSSRTSDHNPNSAGVVRAMDITDDKPTFDADKFAEAVRQLGIKGHPALGPGAYVICNRRIASATYGWVWKSYSGSNPHDKHTHVSVSTAASGYDSTEPWNVTREEDPMTQYADQLDRIEKKVDKITEQNARIRRRVNETAKALRQVAKAQTGKIRDDLDGIADQLDALGNEA